MTRIHYHKRRTEKGCQPSSPMDDYVDNYLPPEVWRQVFARLPAKTLMRFRSVCKTWCSLIDSPDFIPMHLKLYQNNCKKNHVLTKEISRGGDCSYSIRRSDTVRKIGHIGHIPFTGILFEIGMVDGMMLMGRFVPSNMDWKELRLWNPSICKSLLLPPCPFTSMSHEVRYHLGFASSSDDYKVVAFQFREYADLELPIAVFSLRDHIWRVKPNRINAISSWCSELIQYGHGVLFSRGIVYWKPSRTSRVGEEMNHLVSFVFNAEEFSLLELPHFQKEMLRFIFLLGESLAVFGISPVRSCIWTLEKDVGKKPWREVFSGDSTSFAYKLFADTRSGLAEILYVEDTGTFLIRSKEKLMSYSTKSHRIERLGRSVCCVNLETYVESLVLHKGSVGVNASSFS